MQSSSNLASGKSKFDINLLKVPVKSPYYAYHLLSKISMELSRKSFLFAAYSPYFLLNSLISSLK